MKRKGKIWFFVVAFMIIFLAITTITGITTRHGDIVTDVVRSASNIRFGIDIRGGVDVSFVPADGTKANESQMAAAQAVIEQRLISLGITDYEIYKDVNKSRVILRFPWKVGETEFNPEEAIQELAATAMLTFREGNEVDQETGKPTGVTAETVILEGTDVEKAEAAYGPIGANNQNEHFVSLTLSDAGTKKFAEATKRIAEQPGGTISIWMDDTMISAPTVNEAIPGGKAMISGSFDAESATALADKINAGSLPFALKADSFSTISPTLGSQSLRAMVLAGIVALVLVFGFMIFNYRLSGFIAGISLIGQTAGALAFISGYFAVFQSFTLTLPGIAGIILSIGMGVDANVITAERIKEELRSGKKLDNALKSGFERGLSPIIDGNVTVLIVSSILMGAFGPTDGFFAKLFSPIFSWFGPSTAGSIYSFGYTLMIGVLLNFVFGVFCTRVMLTSISKFKAFRNVTFYGGLKEGQKAPENKVYNIVGSRNKFFALSGIMFAVIIFFTVAFGVTLDVQFSGGAIITYSFDGDFDIVENRDAIVGILGDQATLQEGSNTATGGKTLTITMAGSQTVSVEKLTELSNMFRDKHPDNNFEQLEVNNVDASVGGNFFNKSMVAILSAMLLILVYVAFRFRKIGGWRGGATAVAALIHDIIIIYGVFAVMRIPLNGNFMAALLTILGYSINDTVVIYDRIRENRGLMGKKADFSEIVNLSINQSLKRSVNTTLTTMLALGCVVIFGAVFELSSIMTFAFPLMIGMVSGVYSTIVIAGPLWVMWENHDAKKGKSKKKTEEKKAVTE